jgi:glycosyltransferase involved in cell wall biosynthesis
MEKLKVFVIGTRGFPGVQGGIETHCQELYTRLAQKGCDVTVATRRPYIASEHQVDEWEGVNLVHLWCPKIKGIEAISHTFLGVLNAIRSSPDILHVHAIGPSLFVPFAKLFGMKVVVTHHGPDYQRAKWGTLAKSVLRLGEYMGTKFADKVIVISNAIKELLEEKYQRTDQELIPNGVKIPTNTSRSDDILHKFGLVSKKYAFVASRFVPEKGLHDLVLAYAKIRNPEFKLVISGRADHETSYSRYFETLAHQTAGVVLTGFVKGKPLETLYAHAGLFVLPSHYEGLPIALLEALSYHLPVLVSDIPQHKEVPLPAYRYFPVKNTDALAMKLVERFSAGILLSEIESQVEFLQSRYNWDLIAEQTLDVYRSLETKRQSKIVFESQV